MRGTETLRQAENLQATWQIRESLKRKGERIMPNSLLWNTLLERVEERIITFDFKFNNGRPGMIFLSPDFDEQIIASPRNGKISANIEWYILRSTPETKTLTTIIFDTPKGNPQLTLMQDVFSIFMSKDTDVTNVFERHIPRQEWQIITITDSGKVKFHREGPNLPIENIELPVDEAVKKFFIPA